MPTLSATFLRQLREKDACPAGYIWARTNKATGFADAWARLPRADWMLWLADKFGVTLDPDLLRQFAFECADRAIHIHAAGALRNARLTAEAEQLDAVATITDEWTAGVAARAAWATWAVDAAAWAAVDAAAEAVDAAAEAAGAAGDAAEAAGVAARAAAWAAWDAADAAAEAAAAAAQKERQWGADRLRVVFPALGADR